MSVRLAKIRPGPELTFNWTEVTTNCQTTEYIITSDCGSCPAITTFTTVVCANVHIDGNRICSFAVRTKVCGSIEGTQSNNLSVILKGMKITLVGIFSIIVYCIRCIHIMLSIKVPGSPTPDVVPVYSQATGRLIGLNTALIKAVNSTYEA